MEDLPTKVPRLSFPLCPLLGHRKRLLERLELSFVREKLTLFLVCLIRTFAAVIQTFEKGEIKSLKSCPVYCGVCNDNRPSVVRKLWNERFFGQIRNFWKLRKPFAHETAVCHFSRNFSHNFIVVDETTVVSVMIGQVAKKQVNSTWEKDRK